VAEPHANGCRSRAERGRDRDLATGISRWHPIRGGCHVLVLNPPFPRTSRTLAISWHSGDFVSGQTSVRSCPRQPPFHGQNSSRITPVARFLVSPWRKYPNVSVHAHFRRELPCSNALDCDFAPEWGTSAATTGKSPVMANPCGSQLPAQCGRDYTPHCAQWKSVASGGKTYRCCVKRGCRYAPVIK
jgi:hypothetical protein